MSLVTPDFGLLFWMTVIFAIVFFILAKWGFPAITGMVDKRAERIEESIEKARKAEKMLAEMTERQARMLDETRAEQARILKEAAQARDAVVGQAKQQAQEETEKMLQHARTQIAAEKESALLDIRSQVAAMSVDVAERILREKLSDSKTQLDLITRMVDEIAGTDNPS